MRWSCLVLLIAVVTGCASTPKKPTAAELAAARLAEAKARETADARVLEGCYDCLIEARDIYERLAVGAARASHLVPLFETSLLLALRERELAIDSTASLARARAVAAELPPALSSGAARYVTIVEAVPPDGSGVPYSADLDFRRSQDAFIRQIREHLAWLSTGALRPEVRTYLSLSIDCKYRPQTTRTITPNAPPLLIYREATCDQLMRVPLQDVLTRVPAFAEAAYFLARIEVANAHRTGAPAARPLLATALARFPSSASVLYLNGNYNQLIGDFDTALTHYDPLLAMAPRHELGLLGRTISLFTVNRHDEAFVTATQMIDWQAFNMNEAYYWRSWIWYVRKDLPAARADIDRGKSIGPTPDIYRLAGIIEHDQDDLAIAKQDLLSASKANPNDCIARWYLGMVAYKERRWLDAGVAMEDSMACYERVGALSEAARRNLERQPDVDPVFRARQLKALADSIEQCRSQYHAGAFNAASYYAREGSLDKAKALLDIAAKDPALDARVAELRKAIGGG